MRPSDLCGCQQKRPDLAVPTRVPSLIIWSRSLVIQVKGCACTKSRLDMQKEGCFHRLPNNHPPTELGMHCIVHATSQLCYPCYLTEQRPRLFVFGCSHLFLPSSPSCSRFDQVSLLLTCHSALSLSLCSCGTSDTSISHSYKRQADLSACAFASLPSSPATFLRTALVFFALFHVLRTEVPSSALLARFLPSRRISSIPLP